MHGPAHLPFVAIWRFFLFNGHTWSDHKMQRWNGCPLADRTVRLMPVLVQDEFRAQTQTKGTVIQAYDVMRMQTHLGTGLLTTLEPNRCHTEAEFLSMKMIVVLSAMIMLGFLCPTIQNEEKKNRS